MHPVLFEVGNWPVYSYGVLLALAYLAGLQLAVVRARRAGLDGTKVMDLGIYLIIAALLGANSSSILIRRSVSPCSCAYCNSASIVGRFFSMP